MTQRVFDVDNKQDMKDLWNILPDWANKVFLEQIECFDKPRVVVLSKDGNYHLSSCLFNINWHNKTEIIRPIQEATEEDVGKICWFWYDNDDAAKIGVLEEIDEIQDKEELDFENFYVSKDGYSYHHCRRLTKQEIEELL